MAGSEVTAERRAQVYTPDYLLSGRPRPRLTQAPRTVGYGATFMLGFDGVPTLDRCASYRVPIYAVNCYIVKNQCDQQCCRYCQ